MEFLQLGFNNKSIAIGFSSEFSRLFIVFHFPIAKACDAVKQIDNIISKRTIVFTFLHIMP